MRTLDEVADAFWALAQQCGTEMAPEDLLKNAKSHDPRDMPDKIIWGETFGKRWIAIRVKGGGNDSIRVAMIGELNGTDDGWHLILGGDDENQNLFDLESTRVTKAVYAALTALVADGSVFQTRGGRIFLI